MSEIIGDKCGMRRGCRVACASQGTISRGKSGSQLVSKERLEVRTEVQLLKENNGKRCFRVVAWLLRSVQKDAHPGKRGLSAEI